MSLMLNRDESFSMSANVTTPGYQRVVLRGYLKETRPDGVYVASLIPQLFFGADGTQLTTWRQYISGAGSQTILSRSAGSPMVPREELFWRKISDFKELVKVEVTPLYVPPLLVISLLVFIGGTVLIILSGRR